MTMHKTIRVAVAAAGALALSGVSATAAAQSSDEWHKKSNTEKGVDQIKAQTKGDPYANPDRNRALNDAMRDDGTSRPVAKPKSNKTKSSGASPQ